MPFLPPNQQRQSTEGMLLCLLNNLKLTMCVLNKTKLKEVSNWHVNNTKQNFVAPDQINPKTS